MSLEQDRVLGRNLRGKITKCDDGRERTTILNGDDMRRMGRREKIKRLAVAGIDFNDRFFFNDEVGEEIAKLHALVLDGLISIEGRTDAGRLR